MGIAESRQQAMDLYTEPAEYFYGRCLHIDPRFAMPPGYTTEATIRAGVQGMVQQAAQSAGASASSDGKISVSNYQARQKMKATQMKDIVDGGYVIIGSPDEVVEQIRDVAKGLNIGHLMLLLQFGNMGKDLAKYNTRMFAEHVMPRCRDVFPQWEDRWWPKPMDAAQRAAPTPFQPRIAAE